MRTILFVCSGNTCRSPLALAAWRVLEKSGKTPSDTHTDSAGIAALNGRAAAKHAITVARSWGEDLSEHRSKVLLPRIAQSADRIAIMERAHLSVLQEYFHVPKHKIVLLGSFDPQSPGDEILDPFGGPFANYEICAQNLRRAVEGLAEMISQ